MIIFAIMLLNAAYCGLLPLKNLLFIAKAFVA